MFFGNDVFRKLVLNDARQFAQENNCELVYGAVIGSISKGLQYEDSDYDLRFLYIDKKNSEIIHYPMQEKEMQLKKRTYFEDKPYDCIPFWELSSFIQFLMTPGYDGVTSSGIYNVVGWTLQSPYTWDPYGLQMKLMPIANSIFQEEYYIPYRVDQIMTSFSRQEKIVIKDYLYAVYDALCIKWAQEKKTFPPVYMQTLLSGIATDSIKKKILDMIDLSKKLSTEYLAGHLEESVHTTHFVGEVAHDLEIDLFIEDMLHRATCTEFCVLDKKVLQEAINNMHSILHYSFNKETKVKGVNM